MMTSAHTGYDLPLTVDKLLAKISPWPVLGGAEHHDLHHQWYVEKKKNNRSNACLLWAFTPAVATVECGCRALIRCSALRSQPGGRCLLHPIDRPARRGGVGCYARSSWRCWLLFNKYLFGVTGGSMLLTLTLLAACPPSPRF